VGHVYISSENNPNILVPTKLWYLENPDVFKNFVAITEQTEFPSGVGLPGRVLALKKAVWILNVHDDNNFPRAKHAKEIEVKGAFGFPVTVEDEIAGVLEFFSSESAEPNPKLLETMSLIGVRLGRVIERDRAQKKLTEAKELAERANAAKSEFLSRMSHELRTPMTAILGFSQLMMHNRTETLTASQKENVQEIRKAGNHLLTLINEVLDLSRIESGEMTVSLEPVRVLSVIEEVLILMGPVAKQENIQLLNEVHPNSGWSVKADRLRLKQVLMNLVSNAIKYNKMDGTARVMCEVVEEKSLRIHVKDTGPGISEEQKVKLFHPFERLGAEYTQISGTGIGLIISSKLMTLMGGKISMDSQLGEGSCFSIELPVLEQDSNIGEEEIRISSKQARSTVLYIEDNPASLRLVKKAFANEEDVRFLSAPDGKLGIELGRAHLPDLFLVDIHLPEEDGISILRQLQMYEETRNIPAIAISSSVMPREIDRALAAGFKHFIPKPIDVEQLLELVLLELGLQEKLKEKGAE
jgi:signal transduction histidine kinase/ActR/RegA family two-component response regulator